MAITAVFEASGDPDEPIVACGATLAAALGTLHQPQRLVHIRFRRDEGIGAVDVWESREAFEAMYDDPDFRAVVRRTGRSLAPCSRSGRSTTY
jgi:hypothetical protein